jgi:hypothetical protein
MIRYVGLAIFACICFLGGYFTGQWTTFKQPVVDALVNKQAEFFQAAQHIQSYGCSAEMLRLVRSINSENHAQFEQAWLKEVQRGIKDLEEMQANPASQPYALIIKTELVRLKLTASSGNGPE